MVRKDLLKRLMDLDIDAQLTFDNKIQCKCYIVGGAAFSLLGYSVRATHDIDVIERYPKELSLLFEKHDMNTDVLAYYDSFPQGFEDRAIKIDIPTQMISFYVLSIEDLIISKLCTTRERQDISDIYKEDVVNNVNWDKLKYLADELEKTKVSGIENFRYHYQEYVQVNKNEKIDV